MIMIRDAETGYWMLRGVDASVKVVHVSLAIEHQNEI